MSEKKGADQPAHADDQPVPDFQTAFWAAKPHPGDRRLVWLLLTERGRSLEGVIAAETDKVTERALAAFGPAERESLIRALAAIRRNLTGP